MPYPKLITSSTLILLVLTAISIQAEDSLYLSVDTTIATYCDQPEARQFDFWLGEWHLSWGEGTNAGTDTNSVTSDEWQWERSDDNGASWQVLWHISYVRKK